MGISDVPVFCLHCASTTTQLHKLEEYAKRNILYLNMYRKKKDIVREKGVGQFLLLFRYPYYM